MGSTERGSLDKGLKDLNLSTEEVGKFEKAFKDPEFMRLFAEYAKEVSDPKAKEETDQYLRQLETQGRAEEVYGKGVQLIVPTEAFVLKAKQAGTGGAKVFINVCSSDKVAKVELRDATDASGKVGKHVDLPLTLGSRKEGKDKNGQPCSVYDFVVHPDSIKFAHTSPGAMKLLADTAIEHIEKVSKSTLSKAFKVLNIKYKGTEACPAPQVLSVRTADGGEALQGRLKPQNVGPADMPAGASLAAAPAGAPAASSGEGASRSGFAFPKAKGDGQTPAQAQAAPTDPSQAGYRHASGEVTPTWELVHRGAMDLSTTAWADAGRGLHVDAAYPKELVVRAQLPDMASAAGVDLDVSAKRLQLVVPNKYRLVVALPFAVDDTKGRAKFDKAKRQLEITLPVVPPPPPSLTPPPAPQPELTWEQLEAAAAAADAAKQAAAREAAPRVSAGAGAEGDGPRGGQAADEQAEAGLGRGHTSLAASTTAGAPTQEAAEQVPSSGDSGRGDAAGAPCPSAADEDRMTENQRLWNELHAKASPPGGAAATSGSQGQREDTDGPGAALQQAAGDGMDGASAAVPAPAAPPLPVVNLKPRLNRGLVDELD